MDLPDLIEQVAAGILDHFELDFEEYHSAAISFAYRITEELEDTTRRTLVTASKTLVDIAQNEKLPDEHVSGVLFAAGYLATESDRAISLLPEGEITTENFLPDPYETTELTDPAPYDEVPIADQCGDARDLRTGEYVLCDRPKHLDGHWHMMADEDDEVVAMWRGNEEISFELEENETDEED